MMLDNNMNYAESVKTEGGNMIESLPDFLRSIPATIATGLLALLWWDLRQSRKETKTFTDTIRNSHAEYKKEMENKLKDFRDLSFKEFVTHGEFELRLENESLKSQISHDRRKDDEV